MPVIPFNREATAGYGVLYFQDGRIMIGPAPNDMIGDGCSSFVAGILNSADGATFRAAVGVTGGGLHAASHQHGGNDEVATATAAANAIPKAGAGGTLAIGWVPTGSSSSTVCIGNDVRLSDARTPIAHTHLKSDITSLVSDLAAKAPLVSPSFTTPDIGAAAGTSLVVTGNILSSGGGIGYAAGAGGIVTQLTSKSTGVTLGKRCGAVTTHNAALAAAAEVTFTVTNSQIAAGDVVIVNHASGGTSGAYAVHVTAVTIGAFNVTLGNMSAGSLSQALTLNFAVIKAATT